MTDPQTSILSYRLGFSEPQAHLVDVELVVPRNPDNEFEELWMPVWTPGSYMVREYSRHVQDFAAQDENGTPVPWEKTRKNCWRAATPDRGPLHVSYRVYGWEPTVRTNLIEGGFAFLNGAATFLTVRGREQNPHQVHISPPGHWAGIWTSLPEEAANETDEPGTRTFTARDHDEIVDSPLLAGSPAVHPFTVADTPLVLVNVGEGGLWDGARAADDVRRIVEEYRRMFGSLPFSRYLFLNLIVEGKGGLEHKDSCVMMASRYSFGDRKAYVDWLGLASHEFFHVWNVKRSRPVNLGPFDYESEVYSRSLWVAEGITAYYTDLIPARAGVSSEKEFLEKLSDLIASFKKTPGRSRHSLEDSSFDAWIKLYRRDENTANTTVSYYVKGALVAWLLDMEIRKSTRHERTLDHLMRLLFERYSGETGYSDADIRAAAEEIADRSLEDFFRRFVQGREDLDFTEVLEFFGLRFRPPFADIHPEPPPVRLGIQTTNKTGKLVVEEVRDDGPARGAGISAGDEIIALGGYRVDPQTYTDRLKLLAPGQRVEILIARRDALQTVPVVVEEHPGSPWRLEPDPEAGEEARTRRRAWLQGAPDRS